MLCSKPERGGLDQDNVLYQIIKITLRKKEHREMWKGLFSMSMGQRAQGAGINSL